MTSKVERMLEQFDMNKLERTWDDIDYDADTNWDNLMEMDEQGLRDMYDLTELDAGILWMNIQVKCDNRRQIMTYAPSRVGHMINEALHQSLDGWTIEQGMVINAFLADIAYACWNIQEDERLAKLRRDDLVDAQIAFDTGADITDGATDEEK